MSQRPQVSKTLTVYPGEGKLASLWLSLPRERKWASLRLRRIDPLTVTFRGRRVGLLLPQMDRPSGCHFLGRRVGPYIFTAAVTLPQMDRPFSPHFHGKRSRPRFVSDGSTIRPSLSSEGKSASLRLGWFAKLDYHYLTVGLPPPRMDRLVGPSLHGEGRCLASI